jgi:hypothetical protein
MGQTQQLEGGVPPGCGDMREGGRGVARASKVTSIMDLFGTYALVGKEKEKSIRQ